MVMAFGTLDDIFIFFKILIFQVVTRVKGQQVSQNGQKFCLLHSISQEPYII